MTEPTPNTTAPADNSVPTGVSFQPTPDPTTATPTTDANGLAKAATTAPATAAAPVNPVHKIADGIISAFSGTNGSPGAFLRATLSGGLAGLAAAAKAPRQPGAPILSGLGAGAEAGVQSVQATQAKQNALSQQDIANKQKQQQLDLEQNRDKYLNAEANARMVHEQMLTHQAGEEAVNKSIDTGKSAVALLQGSPIPGVVVPGFEQATAQELNSAIQIHTKDPNDPHGLDPTAGSPYPTGRKVVGQNPDGTPQYATTYTFVKMPPEVTLDETNRKLLEGVPGYDKMAPGTKMSGAQFNSMYQESQDIKAATAARDKFISDVAGVEEASKLKLESVNLGSDWNNALANNGNDPFVALNAMQQDAAMKQKYPHLAQDVETAYGGPKEWETMRHNRVEEGVLTLDKALNIVSSPGIHSKDEVNKAQHFIDAKNENSLNEAVALTKAKGIATGKDYENFLNYGQTTNPDGSLKKLNLGNAPDNMLVNGKDGSVIPIKMQQGVKPGQTDSARATFAQSVLHSLDILDQLKQQGKVLNGPIVGVSADWLASHGISGDSQEARDILKFAGSAATGAHVGGRFNQEIMHKMDQMLGMNMGDEQFAAAEKAIREVMKPYSENGGRLTVGEYKEQLIGTTQVLKDGRKVQVTGFDPNTGAIQGQQVQ